MRFLATVFALFIDSTPDVADLLYMQIFPAILHLAAGYCHSSANFVRYLRLVGCMLG